MMNWFTPTLDPEELDKRIAELKTVLFWLEQNCKAVNTTIQALEVQKLTLSTLQTLNINPQETPLNDVLTAPVQTAVPKDLNENLRKAGDFGLMGWEMLAQQLQQLTSMAASNPLVPQAASTEPQKKTAKKPTVKTPQQTTAKNTRKRESAKKPPRKGS